MDNIGFYSALGYRARQAHGDRDARRGARREGAAAAGPARRAARRMMRSAECRALTDSLIPGWDFSRELRLTEELAIGQTLLLRDGERLVGFALCHTVPLVEGRALDEMRVLKLVLASDEALPAAISGLTDLARRHHARRVAMRAQTEYLARVPAADRGWRARAVDRSAHDARRTRGAARGAGADLEQLGDLSPTGARRTAEERYWYHLRGASSRERVGARWPAQRRAHTSTTPRAAQAVPCTRFERYYSLSQRPRSDPIASPIVIARR